MADLENPKTETLTVELDLSKTTVSKPHVSAMNESPSLTMLDTKLLKRRKRAVPYTYRRPSYLQYIDYA
jgi:hypothetical protein